METDQTTQEPQSPSRRRVSWLCVAKVKDEIYMSKTTAYSREEASKKIAKMQAEKGIYGVTVLFLGEGTFKDIPDGDT